MLFLATIPIAIILIYENWPNIINAIKKGFAPALISLVPLTALYIVVFLKFNYTYVDWITYSNESYAYASRIVEYNKKFRLTLQFSCFPSYSWSILLYSIQKRTFS